MKRIWCGLNLVTFHSSSHEELPLAQLFAFPNLWEAHSLWDETSRGQLPETLDPVKLPRAVLPYLMVMDIDAELLRVRLAGTRLCDEYRAELRGLTAEEIFEPQDAMALTANALQVARSGEPSLVRQSCITISERRWSYAQLLLPLSSDGMKVDRLMKLIDPSTLVYVDTPRKFS
jgi:hypothetical protein